MSKKQSKHSRISSETKIYKTTDIDEEIPKKKKRKIDIDNDNESISKKRYKEKKSKKRKILKFIIIVLLIILIVKFLISFFTWKKIATAMIENTPSIVVDAEGNVIAEIGTSKITENISLSDIPNNLKNAYVAIEDQRFYKHKGIDIKRTGAATLSYIKNFGKASFGGSTITQQLVKNITGDNTAKISRKFNEWLKAFELELFLDKDEILEAYFNIIYTGPNIYGVASGSKYYFNKSVSDLSLAECAFLAGLNNAPNAYNPFRETSDNSERIQKRTKTVLKKMLELNYITEDEFNTANSEVENGLSFNKGELSAKNSNIYSYHTDALISEVISDLKDRKNMSKEFATNYLEMGNLKIYSTQISKVQDIMNEEFAKKSYILKSQNSSDTSQAAMVIIDQSTGYVVGCTGGLGEKNMNRSFNRATQSVRQTGSAIKPIAVLAPAIQNKIITCCDIYSDKEITFNDGSDEGYTPTNYNTYLGNITIRQAVESSQNIPFVSIMEKLTPNESIKYMEKLGITTLQKKDNNLALALGGLVKGISPLEMAGAYATIANNGIYIEPTFYTLVENSKGKKVIKSKQESHRAISEETAYILTKLLNQPVNGTYGTATYCKLDGIEVAAKTGTTNNNYDRWLCEYTPYYTAVTWYGFDLNERINYNGNPAGLLSARVMSKVHNNLEPKNFNKVNSVKTATICPQTGLVANSGCPNTYTEYFIKGTIPGNCNIHTSQSSSHTTIPDTTINTPNINLDDESVFEDKEVPEDTYNKEQDINNNIPENTTQKPSNDSLPSSNTQTNTYNNTQNTSSNTQNITNSNIENTTVTNNNIDNTSNITSVNNTSNSNSTNST